MENSENKKEGIANGTIKMSSFWMWKHKCTDDRRKDKNIIKSQPTASIHTSEHESKGEAEISMPSVWKSLGTKDLI